MNNEEIQKAVAEMGIKLLTPEMDLKEFDESSFILFRHGLS
jgi:hypothetical protein